MRPISRERTRMGFAIINKNSILDNAPAAGAFFFFFLLVFLALIVAEI